MTTLMHVIVRVLLLALLICFIFHKPRRRLLRDPELAG
jgi:hypothetical protein